jgi:hypothetical protein
VVFSFRAALIGAHTKNFPLASSFVRWRPAPRVRLRLPIFALLLAWLCANGALLDGVQAFAWGKMIRDNSQTMSLSRAIAKTFDGSAPCEICRAVSTAKQQQPPVETTRAAEKLLLVCQPVEKIFVRLPDFQWPGAVDGVGLVLTYPVPVPPPRA